MNTVNNTKKSYDLFLEAILTFECSIDPEKANYYRDNYYTPDVIEYQDVEYPGRVKRADDGTTLKSKASIKEYFERIGIDKYYIYGSSDVTMFKKMQYAVVNYLGFVGYQFSEQDLWDLGYYTHYDNNNLPMYYSDVPVSNWAGGVRDKVMDLPGKGKVHVTDVNTWKGTFTGKQGINSFEDFIDPEKQDYIAKDHFSNKFNAIVSLLAQQGKKVDDYVGKTIKWSECHPVITPPAGFPDEVVLTMSGLLAGAHLRGAEGVVALLIDHENRADENGTAILQYIWQFKGYDTPFTE